MNMSPDASILQVVSTGNLTFLQGTVSVSAPFEGMAASGSNQSSPCEVQVLGGVLVVGQADSAVSFECHFSASLGAQVVVSASSSWLLSGNSTTMSEGASLLLQEGGQLTLQTSYSSFQDTSITVQPASLLLFQGPYSFSPSSQGQHLALLQFCLAVYAHVAELSGTSVLTVHGSLVAAPKTSVILQPSATFSQLPAAPASPLPTVLVEVDSVLSLQGTTHMAGSVTIGMGAVLHLAPASPSSCLSSLAAGSTLSVQGQLMVAPGVSLCSASQLPSPVSPLLVAGHRTTLSPCQSSLRFLSSPLFPLPFSVDTHVLVGTVTQMSCPLGVWLCPPPLVYSLTPLWCGMCRTCSCCKAL